MRKGADVVSIGKKIFFKIWEQNLVWYREKV